MSETQSIGSRDVAAAAIRMAISSTLQDEKQMKAVYAEMGIKTTAANFGGEFIPSINKIIERAVVAAKREGIISQTHSEEGAVAGATREAVSQVMGKAIGLNVGGKIGIARYNEHVGVTVFFGIGLLHLNEVAVGLGHRVI